jgi:multiple sugar transport system ATP-binding protein
VTIDKVVKRFGNLEILHGVHVVVEDGEFVVLVGPSGCGKSTLLRMIAGLEDIDDGQILVGDRVVNDVRPRNGTSRWCSRNYALYPHMTVAQNMGFSDAPARRAAAEIETRVNEAAKILASTSCSSVNRDSSRAGSASASRWAARSCASPRCS